MPKPEEKPEKPAEEKPEKREPHGLTARNRRIGRHCPAKPRREKHVVLSGDWSHDGFGRPARVASPAVGDPAPDGSQTPACRDVYEDCDCYDMPDLAPGNGKVKLLILRFGHEGVMVFPADVPSGSPFRFTVDNAVLRISPAPAVDYELEVVLEGDPPPTRPAPPERETEPALPEDEG